MNSFGQSGLENTGGMNSNFEFNSKFRVEKPMVGPFSGGLSKPRMAKSRKSVNSRSMGSSEIPKMDLGFNPFRQIRDNLSRVSSRSEGDVDGENLNVEGISKGGKFGGAFIESERVSDCMQSSQNCYGVKWGSFGRNHEGSLSCSGDDHNVGGRFGATLPSELPNEFEKLGIQNSGEVSGKSFVFSSTSGRDFVFGSGGIKNLNAQDRDERNGDEKVEPMVVDGMERLNIGDCSEGASDRTDPDSFSSLSKGGMADTSNDAEKKGSVGLFKTPDSKCSLFSGSTQEVQFSAKGSSAKDALFMGRKEKLKESASVLLSFGKKGFPPKDNNSSVACCEKSESCSSMDVSPYREHHDDTSNDSQAKEFVGVGNDIEHDIANARMEDSECGVETQSFKSACEEESDKDGGENEVESNGEGESLDQTQHHSSSSSSGGSSFTFAASTSSQGHASRLLQKKKNRMKIGSDIYIPTRTVLSDAASMSRVSALLSPAGQRDSVSTAPLKGSSIGIRVTSTPSKTLGGGNREDGKGEVKTSTTGSRVTQEACEKWRLRGNQAYSSGELEKAEGYYTQGLSCIPENETSSECLRALVLCYSNRAATRMSLGRMREALEDCLVAAKLDPNFFKAQLRAANCYLALGEVKDAERYFQKLLQSTEVSVERKLIQEASDGVQKAQKVSECMDRSAELVQQKSFSDFESALRVITDALVISPYSEQLLEHKAEALFMLRKYEEVVQLCMQTLDAAEKNSPLVIGTDDVMSSNLETAELLEKCKFRIWRYSLIFKSNFQLGRLEEALDFLEKQEHWSSMVKKCGNETLESLIPQLSTARELIRHKLAGNGAFQAGRHTEAVEHYTAALSLNVESRPFAAKCFGNRAAAYQALGQIADAIADCSLAVALDGNYFKAISRRAALFEMIRDYDQAAKDLQRLLSLLTKQAEGKGAHQSGASSGTSSLTELRQARQRLYQVEEQAKKGIPLDFYLILGVEPSVTAADLRKAYRKAALKHHPDKAGQSLARSESGEGLWKEISEEVYKDADRLFKMIGEAYAVLSDPTKRSHYDSEEETRNGQKKNSTTTTTTSSSTTSNTADRAGGFGSGQQWREAWRSSANNAYHHHRGFEPNKPNWRN